MMKRLLLVCAAAFALALVSPGGVLAGSAAKVDVPKGENPMYHY